jgi:hypothetical protein
MNLVDVVAPFAILAVLIVAVVGIYLRQGRNEVLERLIEHGRGGSVAAFRGTLAVDESQPGIFLRLGKSPEAGGLQFQYRWLIGVGRQAIFDEVIFDGPRRQVELKKKNKHTTASFSEFSALRMRETAGKHASLWHVELLPHKGSAIPFVTSNRSDRQASFEQTAPLARAVSAILSVPVQVVVAGNVWSPGWPPKNPVSSS